MRGNVTSLKNNLNALRVNKTFHRVINVRSHITRLCLHIFLIVVAFVFLYPFLYMLITSIKSESDLRNLSVVWLPTKLHWKNNNSTNFLVASTISSGSLNISRMTATVVDAPDYDTANPDGDNETPSEPDDNSRKPDDTNNADTSDRTIYYMVALIAVSIVIVGKSMKISNKTKS